MSLHIGEQEHIPQQVHDEQSWLFYLPEDVLTHTVAILAKKGAGKTYAAGVIEEEFAEKRLPFVVLDPVGVHYGIRSTADGTKRAYPVVVFGGEHGDIPIERDMGQAVAEAVVDENISCIIDLSELSKGAWRQFVTDFCRELYRRNRNTNPRHVFIEEATEFIPQTRRPEMQVAYEAVERLVRMGRNRGLGVTLISQRSAQVAKDVLSQLDILIALRTVGAHDRKAMLDMFEGVLEHDDLPKLEEFKRTIPRLEDGVAWIWSPEFLKCFEQVRIRERRTFHGGATVQVSEVQLVQARPDVSALRKRLAPPPKKQKAAPTLANCDHRKEIGGLQEEVAALKTHNGHLQEDFNQIVAELDQSREDASRLQQIRNLLGIEEQTWVLGADGQESCIDEEAIVQKVLARIPSDGRTPVQVTPPEALRKKYLQQAVDKIYARVAELEGTELRAMEVLISNDRFWSTRAVTLAGWQSDSGGQKDTVGKALTSLAAKGLAEKGGSGRSEYRAAIEQGVRSELSVHGPTDEEVRGVVQHVLAKVAS